jgi:hypothetical protein
VISWWTSLSSLNQSFYVAAVFFSTLFAWQFVASLGALGDGELFGGEGDGDVGDVEVGDADLADGGMDGPGGDLSDDAGGLATFRLLSVRSILAFGTLFSWAGALYLEQTPIAALALIRAMLWGVAGMGVVAFFFWALPRLTEEGTAKLETAIGKSGQVYIDIPEDGVGQIRILVGGAVSFVRARAPSGRRLPAGRMVRVIGKLENGILEVEEIES